MIFRILKELFFPFICNLHTYLLQVLSTEAINIKY